MSIDIIPVKYAESTLPESMVFQGGASDKKYPIDFILYLLKTKEKLILIDAGCDTLPGFVLTNFKGVVKALEETGFKVTDITDVIITHSHHDHIEGIKYFKNALIHIQKDELSGKYINDDFKVNIFDDEFTVCDGVKIVKVGGHSKGSCIVEVNETNIFVGDECYISDCITEKRPTGASVCPEKSKAFIEKYSNPKYKLYFAHSK